MKKNISVQLKLINFWTKSTIFNYIENIHQYWLLLLTDKVNLKR